MNNKYISAPIPPSPPSGPPKDSKWLLDVLSALDERLEKVEERLTSLEQEKKA